LRFSAVNAAVATPSRIGQTGRVLARSLAAAACVLAAAGSPEWQDFTSPDGNVRLRFPGTPSKIHYPPGSKGSAGTTDRTVYSVHDADGSFLLSIFEDAKYEGQDARQLLGDCERRRLRGGGHRVLNERQVTLDGHAGLECTTETVIPVGSVLLLGREYKSGRFMFSVEASAKPGRPLGSKAHEFLDSLKFLK
jgi:hypothetical protein